MFVLYGLNWKECLVYFDDVIVFGNLVDNYLFNFKIVLSGFRKYNLKLIFLFKKNFCCIFRKEI